MLTTKDTLQNLVSKDFIVGWPYLLGVLLMIPFLISISLMAMMDDFGGIVLGFFTLLTLFLCTTASLIFIFIDSTSNTEMTFASLPIERSTIVKSKYYSSSILLSVSFTLVVITTWIVSFSSIDPESERAFEMILSFRGIISMLLVLFAIQAFMFPFIFKFGSGKGTQTAIFTILILTLLDPVVRSLSNLIEGYYRLDFSFITGLFDSTMDYITHLSPIEVYSVIIIIFLIIISISIMLSQKFYSTRDL